MREIVLYIIAALSSIAILGYTVHMFVGGLVTADAEQKLIIGACAIGGAVVAVLAWDVVKKRRANRRY